LSIREPGARDSRNRVDDLVARVLLWTASGGRRRQQQLDQPPLSIGQIGVMPARRQAEDAATRKVAKTT
jgi:hypothetical protein